MAEGCIKGIIHIMAAHPYTTERKKRSRYRIYQILKKILDKQYAAENTAINVEDGIFARDSYKGAQLGKFTHITYIFVH